MRALTLARTAGGALPSPLWGGVGVGVLAVGRTVRQPPPSPPLPRKGGGSRAVQAARKSEHASVTHSTHLQPPGADRRRPDRLLDRARGARAGRGRLDRRDRPLAGDAAARGRARHRRPGGRNQRGSGRRRRPRHRLHPGRRLRAGRGGDRSAPRARRDRLRRRLGEGLGAARDGAASAQGRAFRARPSGRRHRTFRPGRGLRRTVRQPLVHPDAAARRRSGRRRAARRVLARAWRQCRDHVGRASRPGARHHQPPAAPDRLHHRRHRRRARSR